MPYSLVEPHEKLRRQESECKRLKEALLTELGQLTRSASFAERGEKMRSDVTALFAASIEEARTNYQLYRDRLLACAEIVP